MSYNFSYPVFATGIYGVCVKKFLLELAYRANYSYHSTDAVTKHPTGEYMITNSNRKGNFIDMILGIEHDKSHRYKVGGKNEMIQTLFKNLCKSEWREAKRFCTNECVHRALGVKSLAHAVLIFEHLLDPDKAKEMYANNAILAPVYKSVVGKVPDPVKREFLVNRAEHMQQCENARNTYMSRLSNVVYEKTHALRKKLDDIETAYEREIQLWNQHMITQINDVYANDAKNMTSTPIPDAAFEPEIKLGMKLEV